MSAARALVLATAVVTLGGCASAKPIPQRSAVLTLPSLEFVVRILDTPCPEVPVESNSCTAARGTVTLHHLISEEAPPRHKVEFPNGVEILSEPDFDSSLGPNVTGQAEIGCTDQGVIVSRSFTGELIGYDWEGREVWRKKIPDWVTVEGHGLSHAGAAVKAVGEWGSVVGRVESNGETIMVLWGTAGDHYVGLWLADGTMLGIFGPMHSLYVGERDGAWLFCDGYVETAITPPKESRQ